MVNKVITYIFFGVILCITLSCATQQYGIGVIKIKKNGHELKDLISFYSRVYGYNPACSNDFIKLLEKEKVDNDLDFQLFYNNLYQYFKDNDSNLIFESGFDSNSGDSTIAIYYKYARKSNLILKTSTTSPCVSMHRAQFIFFDKQGMHFFSDSLATILRNRLTDIGRANAEFLKKDTSNRYVWAIFDYTLDGNLVDVCSKRAVNYKDSPYSTNLHDLLKDFAITNKLSRIRVPTFTD